MKVLKIHDGSLVKLDDDDYERVAKFKWYNHRGFVTRWQGRRIFHLHRVLLNVAWDVDTYVRFKNGDHMDCQKENLQELERHIEAHMRPPNHHPNKTSKFKGVGFNKSMRKWCARIQYKGQRITIGYYDSEKATAMAYNESAKKYYGEFAYQNEIT